MRDELEELLTAAETLSSMVAMVDYDYAQDVVCVARTAFVDALISVRTLQAEIGIARHRAEHFENQARNLEVALGAT